MAYLHVYDGKFEMKDGPKDTLFGLIGATKNYRLDRTLGGIVKRPCDAPMVSGLKREKVADHSERSIGGKNATKLPGAHFGQVPYPGFYMKALGDRK